MGGSESGEAFLRALALMKSGDEAAQAKDYSGAVSKYEKAIAAARSAPGHDWDQRGFLATCHAVLCGPLVLRTGWEAAGLDGRRL